MWVRFVDDIFAIVKKDILQDFFMHINSLNQHLKFTKEEEENNSLPFLDVLVTKNGNRLQTSVYRKQTHTDRLLDYSSYHPLCHKKSVVKSLWDRAKTICSNDHLLKDEQSYLKSVFNINGYSNKVIYKWTQEQQRENNTNDDLSKRISIPYIKNISETAARLLRKGGVLVYDIDCHNRSN
jgi:hypothetical protein